jgi:dsRNA-specific ribonuclease
LVKHLTRGIDGNFLDISQCSASNMWSLSHVVFDALPEMRRFSAAALSWLHVLFLSSWLLMLGYLIWLHWQLRIAEAARKELRERNASLCEWLDREARVKLKVQKDNQCLAESLDLEKTARVEAKYNIQRLTVMLENESMGKQSVEKENRALKNEKQRLADSLEEERTGKRKEEQENQNLKLLMRCQMREKLEVQNEVWRLRELLEKEMTDKQNVQEEKRLLDQLLLREKRDRVKFDTEHKRLAALLVNERTGKLKLQKENQRLAKLLRKKKFQAEGLQRKLAQQVVLVKKVMPEVQSLNERLQSQLSHAKATTIAAENHRYELETHLQVAEATIVDFMNENKCLAVRVFPSALDAELCLTSLCTYTFRQNGDDSVRDLIRSIIKLRNAELRYLPFALLHSASPSSSTTAPKASEYNHVRLAWLGDRLMRAQLAVQLCSKGCSTEELHKKCEAVACNQRLSKWARARQISEHVVMQQGTIEDSVLATTVEAIMAVVALECGMAAMGRLIDDVRKSHPALDFELLFQA